jgi:phage tail-like protein
MASGRGTSAGNFVVELDGVAALRATEVSGLKLDHKHFTFNVGNEPGAKHGRGHFEVADITVKHATALNSTGQEVFSWLADFSKGRSVERRTFRFILFEEDGTTVVDTYECYECIPLSYESGTHTGGSTDASMFNFVLKPEDVELL